MSIKDISKKFNIKMCTLYERIRKDRNISFENLIKPIKEDYDGTELDIHEG